MFRRQPIVLNWLHKPKTSMFVYWRLVLRRVVTVTDIDPSVVAPKPVVVVVMLVVHANLRHHGLVHPLDECSAPISVYATAIASRLIVCAYSEQDNVPG
jgi:hypothetical protein